MAEPGNFSRLIAKSRKISKFDDECATMVHPQASPDWANGMVLANATGKTMAPLSKRQSRRVEVLLVEDNPGDVRLTQEALKDGRVMVNLTVAADGVEAMDILKRRGVHASKSRPDLILLDLNLPRKNGREVLEEIKADNDLKRIPVIVMTTSKAEQDIHKVYNLNANCYITKPVDLDEFLNVVRSIEDFWLTIVTLPKE
jgi:CheY-like chemotaxis protein